MGGALTAVRPATLLLLAHVLLGQNGPTAAADPDVYIFLLSPFSTHFFSSECYVCMTPCVCVCVCDGTCKSWHAQEALWLSVILSVECACGGLCAAGCTLCVWFLAAR